MKLYHVWEAHDEATSDSFYPTKKAAMERIREYASGPGKPDDILADTLYWEFDDGELDGQVVYLQTVEIEPTREGIARALTNLPNR